MAAAFWYYPGPWPNGAIKISLDRAITTRIGPSTTFRQSVSESFTGQLTTVQWGGRNRITVQYKWGGTGSSDRATRRSLVGLVNHLKRGLSVVFAEDDTKLCAAFLSWSQFLTAASSEFAIATPFTNNLVTDSHLSLAGREIYLRSSAPTVLEEMFSVSSVSGIVITTSAATRMDYTQQAWVMMRESGSWPAMRLQPDRRDDDLIPHDHETAFTLDLPLEEDETSLEGLFGTGLALLGVTPDSGSPLDDFSLPENGQEIDEASPGGKNPGGGGLG